MPFLSTVLLALSSASQPITLTVDATEAAVGVYRVTERLGAHTRLSLPEYIPGKHSPQGRVSEITGLQFEAEGHSVKWTRDPVDPFTFRLALPKKAKSIVATFTVLRSPGSPFHARIPWDAFLLLPTGRSTNTVSVHGQLRVPDGWEVDSALKQTARSSTTTTFAPVNATEFVDSPAQIGKFVRRYDLGSVAGAPVSIAIAGNDSTSIEPSTATISGLKRLVSQAGMLFGGRHFRAYTFLVIADGPDSTEGLEHHESSEDTVAASDPVEHPENLAILLGHEFAHSWNGKYRRPAGLDTKNFSEPMRTELLWVYEGLTEYLGAVLAARSGLVNLDSFKDTIAGFATAVRGNRGRRWRSLADTTTGMKAYQDDKLAWKAESRSYADYYDEGALLWLEVDALIRARLGGTKCLDDFLRAFMGGVTGPAIRPYSLRQLESSLNTVLRYDWKGFFARRVYAVRPDNAMAGISMAGYRYILNATKSERAWVHLGYFDDAAMLAHWGASVKDDGTVDDVTLDSPAFKGGLAPGQKILEVDGKPFDRKELIASLSSPGHRTLNLSVDQSGFKLTKSVSFNGRPLQPHLEWAASKPDLLLKIAKPR